VRDTGRLGRLVRWRIPGTGDDDSFGELFSGPPFIVLERGEHALVSGVVGRIWTIRRDYPLLSDPEEFARWSTPGTVRVVFANWVEPPARARDVAALAAEVRVQAFGVQGRIGLAMVRPLIARFHNLIGSDGLEAAVRLAGGTDPGPGRD
jgi:hypothetical protein